MTKKIFLTSAIAMCIACPSFAEEFPQDGYMQENKTYDNAATENNMDGVYEGTVNANAEYDDILYTISAGKYLPAGGESVVDCNVSGSFCPGLQSQVTYNANNAQGLTSCSDATSGAYTLSDGTGSTADSCYRTCSGNVTIEHATAVSGNDYYGNGADTCEPTECEHGWHVKAGVPDLTTLIGVDQGIAYGAVDHVGYNKTQTMYGLNTGTDRSKFVIDYDQKGKIVGHAICSDQPGYRNTLDNNNDSFNNPTSFVSLTNDTGSGKHCYCQIDGYITDNDELQSVSSYAVYVANDNGWGMCSGNCVTDCANRMLNASSNALAFRAAVFGTITPSSAMCGVNTITINWSDADDANIESKRSVTYGGDVVTPVKAVTKPGKTFKGWKFSKPTE